MYKFDVTIVGASYLSLINGLIFLKRGKNVAIVDGDNLKFKSAWSVGAGMLELELLKSFGRDYNISSLNQIEKFKRPANTIIYLGHKQIELALSPLANIREVARKLPELFTEDFINLLSSLDQKQFDDECFVLFHELAEKFYDSTSSEFNYANLEKISGNLLPKVFMHFEEMIAKSKHLLTMELHYVLQVLFQSFFSNKSNKIETYYLLMSILSPRFILDEVKLTESLLQEFKAAKGQYFYGQVAFWEIFNGRVLHILLDNYHGLIGADLFLYATDLNDNLPFYRKHEFKTYQGLKLTSKIDHPFLPHYCNKRLIFTTLNQIGTEFPHWEMSMDDNGELAATFVYLNVQGTKPSFHFSLAKEAIINSLSQIFPGLDKGQQLQEMQVLPDIVTWNEPISPLGQEQKLSEADAKLLLNRKNGQGLEGIEYFGPHLAQSLGLLSYLLHIQSARSKQQFWYSVGEKSAGHVFNP